MTDNLKSAATDAKQETTVTTATDAAAAAKQALSEQAATDGKQLTKSPEPSAPADSSTTRSLPNVTIDGAVLGGVGSAASRAGSQDSVPETTKQATPWKQPINNNFDPSHDNVDPREIAKGIKEQIGDHIGFAKSRPENAVEPLPTGDVLQTLPNGRQILDMPNGDKLSLDRDGSYKLDAKGPVNVSQKDGVTCVHYANGDEINMDKHGLLSISRTDGDGNNQTVSWSRMEPNIMPLEGGIGISLDKLKKLHGTEGHIEPYKNGPKNGVVIPPDQLQKLQKLQQLQPPTDK